MTLAERLDALRAFFRVHGFEAERIVDGINQYPRTLRAAAEDYSNAYSLALAVPSDAHFAAAEREQARLAGMLEAVG